MRFQSETSVFKFLRLSLDVATVHDRFSFQSEIIISGKYETQLTAKEQITFQTRIKARLLYAHAILIAKLQKCEKCVLIKIPFTTFDSVMIRDAVLCN